MPIIKQGSGGGVRWALYSSGRLWVYKVIRRKGYCRAAHQIIVEERLGRFLQRGEVVHHINENTLDNRPENLECVPTALHTRSHRSANL